ncbi:MAG: BatA domain-containing protein [Planctomycetaceae bacterium]
MTFLQPFILFALPLLGLPILIHLINQNRHRTINWAATMFLLQAKRMARGMARLRYLLIMLARMLAIAGLIFAVSRPMAGGWLGLTAGGAPDTTIVVLDRSVSMEEQNFRTNRSKREAALLKLSELIQNTGRNTQLLLFDSAGTEPLKIPSAADLIDLPETQPTSTAADIPSLMQAVAEYIVDNETGRTDVWVCSDLRQNDWNPTGGRWEAIRSQLSEREGVKLYLLTYPDVAEDNLAVSVQGVHRRETIEGAEVVMDLQITRTLPAAESGDAVKVVPLTFVIDGARSTLDVEMTGNQFIRNGHAIPIDRESKRGWGRIELPRDANAADNSCGFVYAEPAVQKAVVVSDEPDVAELLRIAAGTPSDRNLIYDAEVMTTSQAAAIPWNETALVIWQAAIPDGVLAQQLQDFVASGRTVLFFPPQAPGGNVLFEASWTNWQQAEAGQHVTVSRWRTDADLLANTQSGSPLPVGQVLVDRHCGMESVQSTVLAQLEGAGPLLLRAFSDHGAAYFCATLPTAEHSNLVDNGIVFYVLIQRALARGAASLGAARQLVAGQFASEDSGQWKPLDKNSAETLLSRRGLTTGLYETDDALLAVNRPSAEDLTEVVGEEPLKKALEGLDYTRIDDDAGSALALASEVWRTFLILMIVALMAEAVLCVPEKIEAAEEDRQVRRNRRGWPFSQMTQEKTSAA